MGFFDSKSSTSGASGTAGSQTQQGDPLSLNLSAGDDQRATVNVTAVRTDYGALEAAHATGREAVALANELDQRRSKDLVAALDANRAAIGDTTRLVDVTNRRAFDFGSEAVGTVERTTTRTLDKGFSLLGNVLGTLERSQKATEGLAGDVLQFVQKDREPVIQAAVDIAKQVAIGVVVYMGVRLLIGK